jgi:serine/threonine-protein kinase
MANDPIERLQELLPVRYRVEREIARGGMSQVYRARESHPSRSVAIKVLDERLPERGRERFLQEVELTSRLIHPHIVPIYAAGEIGDSLYYVMPFIEGETLADRLEREGPLSVEETIRIAAIVGRALYYAHERGVVHRDVKPSNILLQDGLPLVADFGVARAFEAGDPTGLTQEGHSVGTPEYMAPEQAQARGDVDGRADQYALACVVYEMLGGDPPFHAGTAQSTLARHIWDTVPSLKAIRPGVGGNLEAVIRRALEKVPADRFADAGEFADALVDAAEADREGRRYWMPGAEGPRPSLGRRFRWGFSLAALLLVGWLGISFLDAPAPDALAGSPYRTSVVVMPLEPSVLSPPAESVDPQALADALTHEIIAVLSRVSWVGVTPFYSAKVMALAPLSVPAILDTLGVEHMLQGSLLLSGDSARILIGGADDMDRQGATQQFRIALADWLTEQNRVAQAVARNFLSEFGDDAQLAASDAPRQGPGQRSYLLGNQWLGRRTAEGVRRSIDLFWTSIRQDPDYAPAYASLSSAYALALNYRYDIGVDAYTAAGLSLALGDRAIELAPNLAAGYASRGYIRVLAGAPAEIAAQDFDRAAELQPNAPNIPSWSARVHTLQGRVDEAFREAVRAAELDPMHPGRQIAVAYQALHVGRYPEAIEYADHALDIEPELMLPRAIKARALVLQGRADECLEMDLGAHAGTRALCLWESGLERRAGEVVDSLSEAYAGGRTALGPAADYTPVLAAEDLATFYGWTGDEVEAARWVEEAYGLSPAGMELRVIESALFDPVREDPGFRESVERLRGGLWPRVTAARSDQLARPSSGT